MLGHRERHLRPWRIEERADRLALVDAPYRFREERGNGEDAYLLVVAHHWGHRAGIRGDELDDAGGSQTLGSVVAEHAVRARGPDLVDAALLQDLDGIDHRRPTIDLVIDHDRALAVDVTDHAHDLAAPAVITVRLLHEHERDIQHLADPPGLVRVTKVGHDESALVGRLFDDGAEMLDQQVARRQLVARDAEEALDLHLVHIHGEKSIRTGDR